MYQILGHLIDDSDIHPDLEKILAIQQMKTPTCVSELHHFLSMVMYFGNPKGQTF